MKRFLAKFLSPGLSKFGQLNKAVALRPNTDKLRFPESKFKTQLKQHLFYEYLCSAF